MLDAHSSISESSLNTVLHLSIPWAATKLFCSNAPSASVRNSRRTPESSSPCGVACFSRRWPPRWFGQRYTVDFTLCTAVGTASIRSAWIVRTGEDFPRLTTCFVLPY